MNGYNIILAGVGGQGLVLTTKLICEAAFAHGYDVKSNDVIGLSQRGGKVWGSIKMSEKVFSPNIPIGEADILLALEPLEGDRWSTYLKKDGLIIMNTAKIPPAHVMAEAEEYPQDIEERLAESFNVETMDASSEGEALGSSKIANTFLVGIMAKHMEIPNDIWEEAIKNNVPSKYLYMNLRAFEIGYER